MNGIPAEVPLGPVTVIFTLPVPAGLTAVICVSLETVKLAAGVSPKDTWVAPVKPLPVIVTVVPPPADPLAGLMPVITGNGRGGGRPALILLPATRTSVAAPVDDWLSVSPVMPPEVEEGVRYKNAPPGSPDAGAAERTIDGAKPTAGKKVTVTSPAVERLQSHTTCSLPANAATDEVQVL